jgi:septal ring factor EnvC (AmiA/AmiB activator)
LKVRNALRKWPALSALLVAGASWAQVDAPASSPATGSTDIDALLTSVELEERRAENAIHAVEREQERLRLRTIARGRAYVRLTRAGLMPAGSGIKRLVDHASKVEGLRRALQRDLARADELSKLKIQWIQKSEQLRSRRLPLQDQQRAMARNQVALASAEDRRLAFERAFVQGGGTAHTAIYGAGVGPGVDADATRGFAALRGTLPFPLTGRSEITIARRRSASGPGLEMHVPLGAPVRAVFPGRVAFADQYSDYGNTVILDHGDGYFTVSANLKTIDVRVGDDVGASTRIGSVGDLGQGSLLYFEIRKGTDTLNPAEWFGI